MFVFTWLVFFEKERTQLIHEHSAHSLNPVMLYPQVLCEVSQEMMECANNLRDDEEEFLEGMLQEEEERDTVYYHQYYHDK